MSTTHSSRSSSSVTATGRRQDRHHQPRRRNPRRAHQTRSRHPLRRQRPTPRNPPQEPGSVTEVLTHQPSPMSGCRTVTHVLRHHSSVVEIPPERCPAGHALLPTARWSAGRRVTAHLGYTATARTPAGSPSTAPNVGSYSAFRRAGTRMRDPRRGSSFRPRRRKDKPMPEQIRAAELTADRLGRRVRVDETFLNDAS